MSGFRRFQPKLQYDQDEPAAKTANVATQVAAADTASKISRISSGVAPELKAPSSPEAPGVITLQGFGFWSSEDWLDFFNERAGILEYDHGLERKRAESEAFKCCVVEWMNQNPQPSSPGACAYCGNGAVNGSIVLPYCAGASGSTWLHADCWSLWYRSRGERAKIFLDSLRIRDSSAGPNNDESFS